MIESATMESVSESSFSSQDEMPRITATLPPKKRWRNQRMDLEVPEPAPVPEKSTRRLVRTRMKRSGQPHRIYPKVLTQVAPAAKPALKLSIFSSFPWKEDYWLSVGR